MKIAQSLPSPHREGWETRWFTQSKYYNDEKNVIA